jgi:uncharacterized protein DUF6069
MSSIASSLSPRAQSRAARRTPFALVGIGTVLAALVANTLVYFIGSAMVAYDPEFLPLADVWGTVSMTLAPAIVAVLLYASLRRFTHRPARIFTIISAVVFVVSLVPDVTYIPTVPGSTGAQTAILIMMHVVAAGVIVRMLTLSERSSAH